MTMCAGYLMILLKRIMECSPEEDDRYGLILQAVAEAHKIGLRAGFRAVGSMQMLRAFIDLPGSGQVSWPVPPYEGAWNNAQPEERKRRIIKWTRSEPRIARTLFD